VLMEIPNAHESDSRALLDLSAQAAQMKEAKSLGSRIMRIGILLAGNE
jgi:hypothetical protein